MSSGNVRYEKSGRLARITLDRPEKRNAMTMPMTHQLFAALADLEEDKEVQCVVFAAEGSAFCGGRDVNELREEFSDSDERVTMPIVGAPVARRISGLPQIVITAINGPALGEGIDLALAGDLAVAAEDAVLGDYHMIQGIVPSAGCWYLPKDVGSKRAMEMLLLGADVTGREAAQMGLVNRAVPRDELESTVESYVDRVLSRPLQASRYTKRAIHMGRTASLEHTMEFISFARSVAAKTGDVEKFTMQFLNRSDSA